MTNQVNKQVKELTDKLEQGINELFESDKYKDYLNTMSKFHNYSLNNVILISMQKPDAKLIAGYNAWKNIHHRQVKQGEKAIKIFAPAPYTIKVLKDKIDPDTHKPVLDNYGKSVQEEVEIKKPAFKIVNVFDVSQTDGKEILSIVNELKKDVEDYEAFFSAIKSISPVPIIFDKISNGAKGYYSPAKQRIVVQEGMSELQSLKTLIHEIAHARLHSISELDRFTKEVQAESIAYVICQHYGLDTSEYSFGYIAGWSSNRELNELKESLNVIRLSASEMITEINQGIEELQKDEKSTENTISESKIDNRTSVLSKLYQKQEQLNKNKADEKRVPIKEKEVELER